MEIKFYSLGEISNDQFDFVVIGAAYKGKWIFVRHKERETWEIPGGHREKDEDIDLTASRELYEETGAVDYEIEPVCDYSVTGAMIKRLLELGEVPFVHIEEENIKSMNLAMRAGFKKDRRIHWIKFS